SCIGVGRRTCLVFVSTPPPPPSSPLFPYTTLFRSDGRHPDLLAHQIDRTVHGVVGGDDTRRRDLAGLTVGGLLARARDDLDGQRSEEHTSELQSRENLVCRLLLEKKKNEQQNTERE